LGTVIDFSSPHGRSVVSPSPRLLGALLVLELSTFGTASAFLLVIAGNVDNGVVVHEVAGLALLLLLVGGIALSARLRILDSRPVLRLGIALGALVAAGSLGAALATGALPMADAGLPIAPLAVLLASVGDAARITARVYVSSGLPSG
jgi:hypothetical protein